MTDVRIDLQGIAAGFDEYRQFTRLLAERDNPDATLVAWADRARAAFSSSLTLCRHPGEGRGPDLIHAPGLSALRQMLEPNHLCPGLNCKILNPPLPPLLKGGKGDFFVCGFVQSAQPI